VANKTYFEQLSDCQLYKHILVWAITVEWLTCP